MTIPEIRYRVDKYDTTTKINKLTKILINLHKSIQNSKISKLIRDILNSRVLTTY